MYRSSLIRKTILALSLLLAMPGIFAGALWAGGNTQFRNPNNASQAINKKWDARMLPVKWVLSKDGLPQSGINNAAITSEFTAAFNAYKSLSTSKLDFQFSGEINLRQTGIGGNLGAGIDGHNLITFTDPEITFPIGVLAVAITFSFGQDTVITNANNDLDGDGTPDIPNGTYPAGTIFDGDIAFNSSEPWSNIGSNGSIDIRAVALHEIGHMAGLAHSCIRDAVMWPFLSADIAAARTLKPDDIAYASYYYPEEPAYSTAFGAIAGTVMNGFSNGPVLGAHVFAVDPVSGNSIVGAYSSIDGSYVIPGLSNGSYLVAIEPLDGEPAGLDPFRINEVVANTPDTNFDEEFYDANESNVEADTMAGLAVAVNHGAVTSGINIVTNTVVVPGVNVILNAGYNLFAYPVEVPSTLKAYQLLEALGSSSEVNAIDRYVAATGTFERAEYVNGIIEGADFPIQRGEGYVVHMGTQKVVSFSGRTDCPNLNLSRGMNLTGIPCPPAAYTAFNLLRDIGAAFEVQKAERFNPSSGLFESALYDGAGNPSGTNFPVVNGEGYVIHMLSDRNNVKIPAAGSIYNPVITSLSPGRGVPGTIVVISGDGFDPDVTKNTVTFNNVGAGVIFATSASLTVTVPGNAASGPVRAIVNGRMSNAIDFVVEVPQLPEDPAGNTGLISGQTANGTISADGEQDRYQFTALAGSLVTISAQSVNTDIPDMVVLLEDPFGIVTATDDNSGGGANARIENYELQSTGVYTIVVSNVPGSGTGPYRLSLTIINRSAPPQISILGGNYQAGLAGSVLPEPLKIFLTGATGAPVSGIPVNFVATGTTINGSSAAPWNAGTTVISTNASGIVSVQSTLSGTPGNYTITVTVPCAPAVPCPAPATFTVAATNTAITSITKNGPAQGTVGKPYPLEIILRDTAGQPVNDVFVGFVVASGGGSVTAPAGGVRTVAGKAATTFTLGTKVKDAQIVAAYVPGQSKPMLFDVIPKADLPTRIRSNRSNFNRMTIGMARLNAIQVEVYDQHNNPVEGVTINYTVPAGLKVDYGLGPNGIFFTDFKTNKDGLNVAMVTALTTVVPTKDEFWNTGTAGLAATYHIVAAPAATGLSNTFNIDVDMGPVMVTASAQNAAGLIGQPLANPVAKSVFRFERIDTYTDTNGDGRDDDNGDFTDENFTILAKKRVQGIVVDFTAEREDTFRESTVPGLQATRTSVASATTDASGIASTGVTLSDVRGVSRVVGSINSSIAVTWYYEDGSVLATAIFADARKFAESTNLIVVPVIISTVFTDSGSGLDFSTLKGSLNGTNFFNGSVPPAVLPDFPEKKEVIINGVLQKTLPANISTESAFSRVEIKYYPHAKQLITGTNTVVFEKVKDKIENQQAATTTGTFTFP